MKRLLINNWISSVAGIIFLTSGICLWYCSLISMDTLVGFSVFPLGLLFSKDKWFNLNKKQHGTK
jgi:hypothetical protein